MAKFMIKASEYKNVCKAVNDRKLAELKKEIIEILKKQDEKEVKKAVDYFNSQEEHYTHLEKSFTGKWIEKAGYGVGTVRIWKGKKYKKIAPGKWARVFDKEGRGTNIAIGKLIAKVQKIDNVEDLMAFVMANKQRFVDENGVDLPVLDKLRAAVDSRNGNVGSKEKTEKKFDSKEVLANLDKYVKTIGGVYGIKKYTEDDDTEKTFARIKDHFDSDSTRTYDDAQGWNQAVRQIAEYAKKEGLSTDELIKQSIKNNIKDESIEGTPTFGGKKTEYMERLEEQSKKAEEGRNKQSETKVNGYGEAADREITSLAYKRDVARKERDFNSYFGRGMDKKNNNKGYSKPAEKKTDSKEDLNAALKEVEDAIDNAGDYDDIEELEKERKQLLKKLGKKPDEKDDTKAYEEEKESNSVVMSESEIKSRISKGKKLIDDFFKENWKKEGFYKNNARLFDIYAASDAKRYVSPNLKSLLYKGIRGNKKQELLNIKNRIDTELENYTKKLFKEYEQKEESEEEKHQNRSDAMKGNKNAYKGGNAEEKALDKIKQYAGKKINSNDIEDIKILDDGERSGFLTFEFKSGNDKYKMTYDYGFGGEKGGASIKKIESEESDYVQKKRDAKEGYWSDEFKERNMNNIKQKIAAMKEDGASDKKIKAYLEETIETNTNDIPWRERAIEEGRIKGNQANDYRDTIQERTVRIENCKELLKEYETKVEKSLEETFLMDMAVEDEIKKLEEEQEEESLFNDYSAKQPELFNSTEFLVREALNRRYNCIM